MKQTTLVQLYHHFFSWSHDGLYIKEVHRCLNQTSFQCIDTSDSGLRGQESDVGTLKVTVTSGEGCTSKHTISTINTMAHNKYYTNNCSYAVLTYVCVCMWKVHVIIIAPFLLVPPSPPPSPPLHVINSYNFVF